MNPVSNSFVGGVDASSIGASNFDPGSLGASILGASILGAGSSISSPDFALKLEELNAASEKEADKVGKEFESVFVSLLLKEMRNTLDSGEGGLFGSEQSDTFGGMFDQFMGQHLAEASPLGIADAIKSYLKNAEL